MSITGGINDRSDSLREVSPYCADRHDRIKTRIDVGSKLNRSSLPVRCLEDSVDREAGKRREKVSSLVGAIEQSTSSSPLVVVKNDFEDFRRRDAKNDRIYGNRVLLRRQCSKNDKKGMMKLGGGNCEMFLIPSTKNGKNRDHPRFQHVGNRVAIAFDDAWQPDGPKYAGQKYAGVVKRIVDGM